MVNSCINRINMYSAVCKRPDILEFVELFLYFHPDFLDVEGFTYIVGGAHLQSFFFVLGAYQPRDKNYRDFPRLFIAFQKGKNFVSVHLRHKDIQQYYIGQLLLGYPDGALAVLCGVYGIFLLQYMRQGKHIHIFVINNKDAIAACTIIHHYIIVYHFLRHWARRVNARFTQSAGSWHNSSGDIK